MKTNKLKSRLGSKRVPKWESVQKKIKKRDKCSHGKSPMIIDGIKMGCCDGNAITCKRKEVQYLLSVIKDLCTDYDHLKEDKKNLQTQVLHLQTQIGGPQTTNIVNNTYVQVNQYPISNVLNDSITARLIEYGMSGNNMYQKFKEICQNTNDQCSTEMLKKIKSPDVVDGLAVKREIVERMSDVTDIALQNNSITEGYAQAIKGFIENQHDCIDKEAKSQGVELLDD